MGGDIATESIERQSPALSKVRANEAVIVVRQFSKEAILGRSQPHKASVTYPSPLNIS